MDFDRMNDYDNAAAPEDQDANGPLPVVAEIKPKREVWGFRQEHLIENSTGINQLFKTFTM